jgi:CheY-like chemotaxis protein
MTIQEVANDLGISVRQAYRDLRQATVHIGEVLWIQRQHAATVLPPKPPLTEQITPTLTIIQVKPLLAAAVKAVQRLSEQNQVTLTVVAPAEDISISADPRLTQQILIHLLSQTIQQTNPHQLYITLQAQPERVLLELSYQPRVSLAVLPITPIIQNFIQRLHFSLSEGTTANGRWLRLEMPIQQATILIVDDNQGLLDLVQRYLIDQSYQILTATNGIEGLKLAEELQPNGIMLDLMMPHMDGWELLQRLRTAPQTAHIPVIICSVIQDPELAYSLGAAHFIDKPISKESLLSALSKIGL